ncbi:ATP-binding protein [Primorskyibacter sp. S187A]|uniref:ATP-binding protein n=1 Tax=Primorskyibacter sp. S187A TaxID=3415130 RepID=UPI003C79B685
MRSQLDYITRNDACETEELRATGYVQAGTSAFTLGANGSLSRTADLGHYSADDLRELAIAPAIDHIGRYHDIVSGADRHDWVRHSRDGSTVLERPSAGGKNWALPHVDWQALQSSSRGNLWKLCAYLCADAHRVLGSQRAMVYRFDSDWSGEIIAERHAPHLEPFLGRHFPPTDMPAQVRQLFVETWSRQIFAPQMGAVPLTPVSDDAAQVDLTHALGRYVSPFHVQFLEGMGAGGSASCALMFEGRLWGMLLLHFEQARALNVPEFAFLQNVSEGFATALERTRQADQQLCRGRLRRLTRDFQNTAKETDNFVSALMTSRTSFQRILGAVGATLVCGDSYCHTGDVPDQAVILGLIDTLGAPLCPFETTTLDRLDAVLPHTERRDIAGASVTKLSADPEAFLLTYRPLHAHALTWGDKPQAITQNGPDQRRAFSPNPQIWVERIADRCAPWSEQTEEILAVCLSVLSDGFGLDSQDLGAFVQAHMMDLMAQPDRLRRHVQSLCQSNKSAMAIALELEKSGQCEVLEVNPAMTEAFALTSEMTRGLSLDHMGQALGLEPRVLEADAAQVTLSTDNKGARDFVLQSARVIEMGRENEPDETIRLDLVTLRDVTEERHIAGALVKAQHAPDADTMHPQDRYSRLAHDLRSPFNALLGLSALLGQDEAMLEGTAASDHVFMQEASADMTHLVQMTLNNAVHPSVLGEETLEALKIRDMLAECAQALEAQMQMRDITFEIAERTQAHVLADARALREVVLTLLRNAISRNVPNGHILASITEEQTHVCVRITDTGQGMTRAELADLSPTTLPFADAEGAGMCLSIAQNLVTLMGGSITLSSQQGMGTTVKMLLQKADRDALDWMLDRVRAG